MTRAGALRARFAKFSAVGLLGVAFQVLLVDVLMSCFHMAGAWATPVAVEIVLLHNFFCHERFTWGDRGPGGRRTLVRLLRFHAGNGLVSIAGNTLLMYALMEKLKIPVLPSAIAAIALCAPANFLLADQWVYREVASGRLKLEGGGGESSRQPGVNLGCRHD